MKDLLLTLKSSLFMYGEVGVYIIGIAILILTFFEALKIPGFVIKLIILGLLSLYVLRYIFPFLQ